MDTSQQAAAVPKDRESSVAVRRQQRSIAEKRQIVEETLSPGAPVARAGALRERQSGVWLAPTVLGRTTWGAKAGDEVAARARKRE